MAEGEIEVKGGIVVYEWVGPDDGDVVVLTPGGRFSKDFPGVHELADALADGGMHVLLWDRPNCGRSDVQLFGRSHRSTRLPPSASAFASSCTPGKSLLKRPPGVRTTTSPSSGPTHS